jgi:nitrite reductase (NADH) small subunit
MPPEDTLIRKLQMACWLRLCSIDDCPPGSAREFAVGDRIIAIVHREGRFHALDGICPHQGGPLGKGTLEGPFVTCPWHGWQFDILSGRHRTIPTLSQPTIPVRVQGQDVLVQLEE